MMAEVCFVFLPSRNQDITKVSRSIFATTDVHQTCIYLPKQLDLKAKNGVHLINRLDITKIIETSVQLITLNSDLEQSNLKAHD